MRDENNDDHPEWWKRNVALQEELDLPMYVPPRFKDGVNTYEVVERLSAELDERPRFEATNPWDPGDWEVRLGEVTVTRVRKRRDASANTIYDMSSHVFEEAVLQAAEDGR